MARSTRRAAVRRVIAALLLALAALAARPSPVASGPRPILAPHDRVPPWQLPGPHAGEDFTTLRYEASDGRIGTWLLAEDRQPLPMVIEQAIVDRFGLEAVTEALTVWNDVLGSRFALEVVGTVDTDARRKRRDGVSRVFLDRTDCDGDYLARAHLHPEHEVVQRETLANVYREADIGICPRMRPERLAGVLRHEVGHIAGLGHLCGPGDECAMDGATADTRCRVMHPAAYDCQEPTAADEDGLVHLHPRLPRIRADSAGLGASSASRLAHPQARAVDRAVLVREDADPRLQVEAAHLAGLLGAPLLLVERACTQGRAGEELNRVLAIHGDVIVIGRLQDCATTLTLGWGLEVRMLAGHDQLLTEIGRQLHRPTVAYVVSQDASALADAVTALPAVLRRGALLLRADGDGLTSTSQRLLDEISTISHVVVAGDARTTGRNVERDATGRGLTVERIDRGYLAATTVALWRHRPGARSTSDQVVLTGTDRDALVTAAAVASGSHWPVLITPTSHLDPAIADALSRSGGGVVVGDELAVPDAVQAAASRAVDR